jgi:hypothetical protein
MTTKSVIEEKESLNLIRLDAVKILDIINDIQAKTEKFEYIEDLIKKEHELLRQKAIKVSTFVRINVGGEIFTMNKHNILRWENSLLRYFLCSDYSENILFLDLDGTNFDRIIHYMNNDYLTLENLCFYNLSILKQNMTDLFLIRLPDSQSQVSGPNGIQEFTKANEFQELVRLLNKWNARVTDSNNVYENIFTMKMRAEEVYQKSSLKADLNVGGKIFSTLKSNLLRYQDSYFYKMLSENIDYNASEGKKYVLIL